MGNVSSINEFRGLLYQPHVEQWRTFFSGTITIPTWAYGISTVWGPAGNTGTPSGPLAPGPTYPYGHIRNWVTPSNATLGRYYDWPKIEAVEGVFDWQHFDLGFAFVKPINAKMFVFLSGIAAYAATGPYRNAAKYDSYNNFISKGFDADVAVGKRASFRNFVKQFILKYNTTNAFNPTGYVGLAGIQISNEPSMTRTLTLIVTGAAGTYANGTITATSAGTDGDNGATGTSTSLSGSTLTISSNTATGAFGRGATITGNAGAWTATIGTSTGDVKITNGSQSAAEMAMLTRYMKLGRDDAVAAGGANCNIPVVGPAWTLNTLSVGTDVLAYMTAVDDGGTTPQTTLNAVSSNNYNFGSELNLAVTLGYDGSTTPQGNRSRHNNFGAGGLPIYVGEFGITAYSSYLGNETQAGLDACRILVMQLIMGCIGVQLYSHDEGYFPEGNPLVEDYKSRINALVAGRTVIKGEENMRTMQLRITYSDNSVAYY